MSAKRMTKRELAVAVAKDVLQQLRQKKLRVKAGAYINSDSTILQISADAKAKENIKAVKETCTVCALGAAALCYVERFNKANLADLGAMEHTVEEWDDLKLVLFEAQQEQLWNVLKRVFSKKQMLLIEDAFEAVRDNTEDKDNEDIGHEHLPRTKLEKCKESDAAVAFGLRYKKDADRLRAIFQNIVKNKGEFKP